MSVEMPVLAFALTRRCEDAHHHGVDEEKRDTRNRGCVGLLAEKAFRNAAGGTAHARPPGVSDSTIEKSRTPPPAKGTKQLAMRPLPV